AADTAGPGHAWPPVGKMAGNLVPRRRIALRRDRPVRRPEPPMFDTVPLLIADEFRNPFAAVSAEVALLRLGFAALLGAAIGFERELNASSAGLRTHIIVALAACLFTL